MQDFMFIINALLAYSACEEKTENIYMYIYTPIYILSYTYAKIYFYNLFLTHLYLYVIIYFCDIYVYFF